ncbi:MAG: WecB/TagA/CpsF family glycosyltransferase [Chitinivibrionales bacterium]|nr:WecB/TagA/CpsF family glycosyltransferase [Chitinivibrionales bacterium]MBD3397308.1 WecB/TagA/CpsF family glycosyltransferase [Chitinivibrionales bacterium]
MNEFRGDSRTIVGTRIDATTYEDATRRIVGWASGRRARMICAANVHVVMEAFDDPSFAKVLAGADLVTPDGVPLVWALKCLGVKHATRVYGPDLTLHVCEAAAAAGIPVALYGSTPACLADFTSFLEKRFAGIRIAAAISPPFRELSFDEDTRHVEHILNSGARILLVGLGCPKQERWIAAHQDRLPLVMLAVGVAFDFHAGRVRQAPRWLMRLGLEWLFRLVVEPRRLWKRYVKHNPRFIWHFVKQLVRA